MANDKDLERSKTQDASNDRKPNRSQRRKGAHGKGKPKQKQERLDTTRSNNPAWYYFDEKLADQVSQMSFQNLAGYPITIDGFDFDVPNIVRVHLNPSPGVQASALYNTALAQNSAINMAAFRLYSKLSAFTGRVQSYAPQDVATMELAMGEVISITEFIRRAFGVAYTMNMRNRDYPRHVLEFGMLIDPDDMFANYSNYRTKFNTIMTLINQIPIPKSVAYFDKCAAIYQKLYLDSPSSMAQTIITVPNTTWLLDEQSYSGGTILTTEPFCLDSLTAATFQPHYLSWYLNKLETMVGLLLNSSSLQVVYTDMLNYAAKQSMDFWKMDYLFEGYTVMPEYDLNFMLQMHNATVTNMPNMESTLVTTPVVVTPYNDVYPDPNKNSIYYNPAFNAVVNVPTLARTGNSALIDMLTDNPSLTDRVEVTRYISICNGTPYTSTSNVNGFIDTALPDHYVTIIFFEKQTSNLTTVATSGTIMDANVNYRDVATFVGNIDWAPRFFECDNNGFTGRYTGDVNFYTTVDGAYIRKLHDFCGLALYDIR